VSVGEEGLGLEDRIVNASLEQDAAVDSGQGGHGQIHGHGAQEPGERRDVPADAHNAQVLLHLGLLFAHDVRDGDEEREEEGDLEDDGREEDEGGLELVDDVGRAVERLDLQLLRVLHRHGAELLDDGEVHGQLERVEGVVGLEVALVGAQALGRLAEKVVLFGVEGGLGVVFVVGLPFVRQG